MHGSWLARQQIFYHHLLIHFLLLFQCLILYRSHHFSLLSIWQNDNLLAFHFIWHNAIRSLEEPSFQIVDAVSGCSPKWEEKILSLWYSLPPIGQWISMNGQVKLIDEHFFLLRMNKYHHHDNPWISHIMWLTFPYTWSGSYSDKHIHMDPLDKLKRAQYDKEERLIYSGKLATFLGSMFASWPVFTWPYRLSRFELVSLSWSLLRHRLRLWWFRDHISNSEYTIKSNRTETATNRIVK